MSLMTAAPLRTLGLLAALFAPLALADETDTGKDADKARAEAISEGRWQGLGSMADLYLNGATPAEFLEAGDEEKSKHHNYAGAAAFYLTAARLDPNNAFASYQAAAALSALDSPEFAVDYLDQARERGFWQVLIMKEDYELVQMRKYPQYRKLLETAEKNYAKHAKDAGLAAFSIPKGKAPAGGWPVLVWLSSYGTEGSSGTDMRAELVGDKAVLVALNGTLKRNDHSFMWEPRSVEPTAKAIDAALKKLSSSTPIDRSKVALMGFSQGAQHAAHLLASYPQQYSGALIVSPGGFDMPFTEHQARGKRVVVLHGAQEGKGNLAMASATEQAFAEGNQVQSHEHAEGHTFQEDWESAYPGYVRFALGI
ncbi:alpha/beta hydrolase [Pseudomonas xanthosomatis]|uniref:alpha/beta hydrolase n=1 Tax=Pseudomonas xanthosomatis TaxID=2842356 RepID=UPI00351579C5